MATTARYMPAIRTSQERVPLPVIDAVITDEKLGINKGNKFEPINITKVEKLLVDPHSVTLFDRHLHALNKVIKHYKNGFLLRDIVELFKILNVCADRVEDNEMYLTPLVELLKICAKPFLKEKASDELTFEQIATESISQLGYMMRCPDDQVQIQICYTILSIYTSEGPPTAPPTDIQKLNPVSASFNRTIVTKSDVSETLVKSLALIENNMAVKLEVLHVLQTLSKYSELICAQMLAADAASRTCTRLMDQEKTGLLLFRSAEILWNLVENGVQDELVRQLNDVVCISQLRDAFIQTLTTGYSHYDRQLRNDLLMIVSLIAIKAPNAPFLETGFAKQLALLATFQEVKSHNAIVKHLKLSTNHEDFEFKKQLVNIMVTLSQDSTILPILSDSKLVLALFSYVHANENTTKPQDWSPAQFEELQLHAMVALCSLAPLLVSDYMSSQGNTRLLILLEWCVSSDDYGGHGNSFHGTGGRGNKRAQMRHCIRLLRSVVAVGDSAITQDLVDQGAINQLMAILSSAIKSTDADDAIDIEMQSDMLTILSCLCENETHRKELFGSEGLGIDILVHYLKMDPQKFTSGLGHHKLMLATVDCVWCCIVGCYLTEDAFLAKEGVFLLLDLIENSPKSMHNLILGCLLDLCDNTKTVAHIRVWRGAAEQSAAHMLCDIWRHEEHSMGARRTEDGAIADGSAPLVGDLQEKPAEAIISARSPSRAIIEVVENMRAKIYALFCKIGYNDLPGMTTHDYITLTIIEQYLNFKMGEVWTEVIEELQQEHIRPVSPDQEALETIARAVTEDTRSVVLIQQDLLRAQREQDLTDEKEFYAEIRENYRQKEKAINDWTQLIARTSNYQLLKAAKEKQEQSVDASRMEVKRKPGEVIHKYEQPGLNTTVYSGRLLTIESTPLHLTGGKLINYDPQIGTTRPREKSIIYE